MIELESLRKVFPAGEGEEEVVAVDDVSLTVAEGETLCLIGTSGCGKTTALRCINRLEEPTRGAVKVGGEDVAGLDPIRLRRRIGYVIQAGGLFPHMTVEGNVGLLCQLDNDKPMILAGAIPAAVLAILTDLLLARVERWLAPKGTTQPVGAS